MKDKSTCSVLLVEDNPGDILIVKETLLENNDKIRLNVITNGEDALNFLFGIANAAEKDSIPDLMILDLNLPKRSGKEILESISPNPTLKKIPVIILTSADIDDDIFTNGRYNIKYYLLKPLELDEYLNVIGFIKDYINTLKK
ncbi:MAG: response regulator [Bacteroidota bacterium]|nr:response regulator [Bacteroidota bacterium]MDP4190752.1 response regulator [Bacteroidota bacterium]MDP4194666.1 response regulator [Bacteroidota bacterium]